MTEVANHRLMSLEDRIHVMVRDEPMFDFKFVRGKFPNESDKTLYRAINKLEAQQRIRFLHHVSRGKVYTAIGQSNLPTIRFANGPAPCSHFLTGISGAFEEGHWTGLDSINELPAVISWFFAIALIEDEKDKLKAYKENYYKLAEMRKAIERMLGYCDSMLKHPAFSGDMEYFTKIFSDSGDETVPTPVQITEFKRWYKKEIVDRLAES